MVALKCILHGGVKGLSRGLDICRALEGWLEFHEKRAEEGVVVFGYVLFAWSGISCMCLINLAKTSKGSCAYMHN